MLKNIRQIARSATEKSAAESKPSASTATEVQSYSVTDPIDKHRAQAVTTHNDVVDVLELAKSDASEMVREAASRRCAQLLKDNEDTRNTLTTLITDHRELFFSITAQSNDDSLRALALQKAETDADLLIIADKARLHDARLAACKKIQSIESVDRCWRSMKTKDKLVTRELKARLDKHREAQDAAETRDASVNKILDEMDKIANGVWQPGTINRFDHFTTQWDQLAFEPQAAEQARYHALHTSATEKATAWRDKQSVQDQRQSVVASLEQLKESLKGATEVSLATVLPAGKSTLQQQQTLWKKLESEPDQSQSQLQQFNALNKALDHDVKQASVVLQAQQLSENTNATQQIHKQLGSLNSAISAKRWGPAKSIHDRLAKKVDRLDARDKANYTEKLARLEGQVKELGDLTEFAAEPKLDELCDHMEKLPSLKLSPNDCANRIKELQTQWKGMAASPAQQKLWPRFKQASDIAYEPCGKFFTARREDHKNKIKARKEICALLENYEKSTDWNEPEWRAVEKVLRTAKQDWKKNQVFDKKQGRALEDRFTNILKLLNEKLDPMYEANAEEKRELIARVKKLGEGEINQHSVNQVKSLMSAWRLSGVCRPKDDKVLWEEFRTASNQIYDSHRGKQREQREAELEHVKRAREIIKTIASVKNSSEPLNEKSLNDLQTEFSELPEFPERDQKRIARDYQKALDSVDRFRQNAIDNNRKRAVESLRHNADLCQQLESLVGQPNDTIANQIEGILSEWQDSDKRENPKATKAMESRRAAIVDLLNTNGTPDYEANTQARRLLCIELEILCDQETPQEDKAIRMQYQLDQLQSGLQSNSASLSKAELTEQLQVRWLTSAPASPEWRDKLESRFFETLRK